MKNQIILTKENINEVITFVKEFLQSESKIAMSTGVSSGGVFKRGKHDAFAIVDTTVDIETEITDEFILIKIKEYGAIGSMHTKIYFGATVSIIKNIMYIGKSDCKTGRYVKLPSFMGGIKVNEADSILMSILKQSIIEKEIDIKQYAAELGVGLLLSIINDNDITLPNLQRVSNILKLGLTIQVSIKQNVGFLQANVC